MFRTDSTLSNLTSARRRGAYRLALNCLLISLGWACIGIVGAQQEVPVRRPEIVEEDSPAPPARNGSSEQQPASPQTTGPTETDGEDPASSAAVAKTEAGDANPKEPVEPVEPAPPKPQPGDELFEYANIVYGKTFYPLAVDKFRAYYETYPKGQHAETALFRFAECHLRLGMVEQAKDSYRHLIRNHTGGQFVSSAAWRIGSLAFNEQDFRLAAPYFGIAAKKAQRGEIKAPALYYQAFCLQFEAEVKGARVAYSKLIKLTENNAFWHKGLLALGRIEAEAGNKDKALIYYARLATEPNIERIVGAIDANGEVPKNREGKPKWKPADQRGLIAAIGESSVKAGSLYSESGESDKAIALFNRILKFNSAPKWKALARYRLIQLHYEQKNHKSVIDAFENDASTELTRDMLPQLYIMVAKSYHELKQHSKALSTYTLIERAYPDTVQALEAGYQILRCQFVLGDPTLPVYADRFIENQRAIKPTSDLIDKAYFLKSEVLFKRKKFADAALAYRNFTGGERFKKNIPAKYHTTVQYKHGWAEAEAENSTEAITALTTFIIENPDNEHVANALAKRAMCYKALENHTNCIKDCDRIIQDFPNSEPVELAYQQKGLISGQRREDQQMIATFEEMLQKFPKTSAKSQALFWIGFGKYRQKDYEECVAPLIQARKMDRESYYENASRAIIHAQYRNAQAVTSAAGNKFIPELVSEIDQFRKAIPDGIVPNEILFWLGMKLFDQEDFAKSALYLSLASNPDAPEASQPILWERLAISRIKIKDWDLALLAAEHQFTQSKAPAAEAKALLSKARALTGKAQSIPSEQVTGEARQELFAQAKAAVYEGSDRQKEGRVNAMLYLQLGDIEFAQNNFEEAAAAYILPATTYDDPSITPNALWKTVRALSKVIEILPANERSSDRGKRLAEQKTELQDELTKRYPAFTAPKEA
jgi:TolA-binding protein